MINRIDQISHLQKKYGQTEEDILTYKEKIQIELQTLSSTAETKEKKEKERIK